jgi:hypothetical protein
MDASPISYDVEAGKLLSGVLHTRLVKVLPIHGRTLQRAVNHLRARGAAEIEDRHAGPWSQ